MPLSDQLVAYYKFDDGSGTSLSDATGNGHTGTWSGTLGPQWGTGKINGAGVFDGSTNYIDIPASASLVPSPDYSVNLWFYVPSTATAGRYLASYRDLSSGGPGWALLASISGGVLSAEAYQQIGSGGYADMYQATTFNAWHMFTMTYDGTTVRAYLDGSLYHSQALGVLPTTSNVLTIGSYNNHSAQYCLDGSVDEMGLWMRTLSASEIANLYNGGSGLSYPFATAYSESLTDTFAESESVGHVLYRSGQDVAITTGSLGEEWSEGYLTQGWNIGSLAEKWTFGSLQ